MLDDRGQELTQSSPSMDSGSMQINQLVMGLGNGMVLNATTGFLEPIAEQGGAIRLKCAEFRSRKLASLSGTIVGQMPHASTDSGFGGKRSPAGRQDI